MSSIYNVNHLDNHAYYPLGSANQSGNSDFDSVFEAETTIYATPESNASGNTATTPVTSPAELEDIFNRAASEYNVDVNLLKAVAKTESNFNPKATSSVGAMGIMQLMPSTAQSLGVKNAYDPEQNIMGGAKYLSQMLEKYRGNTSLALAAYNAGPGNVDKYDGIPPFEETQNYVKKVLAYLGQEISIPNTSTASSGNNAGNDAVVYATPDSSIETSQPDITTIYAVAASDATIHFKKGRTYDTN